MVKGGGGSFENHLSPCLQCGNMDITQHPEDRDSDGLQNTFFTIQPLNLADRPRELHYTQLLGK
jgi:hypothetical protein